MLTTSNTIKCCCALKLIISLIKLCHAINISCANFRQCHLSKTVTFPFRNLGTSGPCMLSCFSRVRLFVTLWNVACQAPLSMGFSRQKYWSGLLSFWGSPQPRDQAHVSFISCICRCVFYHSSHLESPSGSPLFINAYNGKRIKNIALYSICIRKLKAMSKTNSVFISVYVWWGRDTGMGGRH